MAAAGTPSSAPSSAIAIRSCTSDPPLAGEREAGWRRTATSRVASASTAIETPNGPAATRATTAVVAVERASTACTGSTIPSRNVSGATWPSVTPGRHRVADRGERTQLVDERLGLRRTGRRPDRPDTTPWCSANRPGFPANRCPTGSRYPMAVTRGVELPSSNRNGSRMPGTCCQRSSAASVAVNVPVSSTRTGRPAADAIVRSSPTAHRIASAPATESQTSTGLPSTIGPPAAGPVPGRPRPPRLRTSADRRRTPARSSGRPAPARPAVR